MPDSPNVENSAEQIGKLDSEVCGESGSPDFTDDSEIPLIGVSKGSSDFNDESDGEEDLEAILARELLEGGMANVTLYTPAATKKSDYEQDEFEELIETKELKALFQAGYREDDEMMAETDEVADADVNELNRSFRSGPVPDGQMDAGVCVWRPQSD